METSLRKYLEKAVYVYKTHTHTHTHYFFLVQIYELNKNLF